MGRTGEVAVVVDQVLRGGARVAVEDLVVVSHPEAVESRCVQQPDEQEVGRVEVLELVDQEIPARCLGVARAIGIGQQDLDGPIDLLVEVDGIGGHRVPR